MNTLDVEPGPCSLRIQIRQTIRGPWLPSECVYTIQDLTVLWRRRPHTIRNWLWILKKNGHAPSPAQRRFHRLPGKTGTPSPFRRELELRADYVRFMAEVFLEKNIRL